MLIIFSEQRNQDRGIWLRTNVKNSLVELNTIRDNIGYGMIIGYANSEADQSLLGNTITANSFLRNNNKKNISQAGDFGWANVFRSNFWSDANFTDGIVDVPYEIDSPSIGRILKDLTPIMQSGAEHKTTLPVLLYPTGGENLRDSVDISWEPSIHSDLESLLSYSIHYSNDNGNTWQEIATDLNSTTFHWNIVSDLGDTTIILKIITTNSNSIALAESDVSPPIYIRRSAISLLIDAIIQSIFFQILLLGLLIFAILSAGFIWYKLKMQKSATFRGLVSTFNEDFVRKIYHKLIIGLDNVKTELLNQPDQFPEIISSEYAVMANIYPQDIQEELKSNFKGRTILMLIEIAFQPLPNSNTAFISKVLDIPNQTAYDEIKRLTHLEYIQPEVSRTTLLDNRKKNYALTHKGLVFLYLLKESLTTTITKMKKQSINDYVS